MGRNVLSAPGLCIGYENASRPGSFNRADVPELDDATYSRILDLNSKDLPLYEAAVSRLFREAAGRRLCRNRALGPSHERRHAKHLHETPLRIHATSKRTVGQRLKRAGTLAASMLVSAVALNFALATNQRAEAARMPQEPPVASRELARLTTDLINPDAVLSRADLIAFTRFEATHDSAAADELRAHLAGRRFVAEVPLGCGMQPVPHATASARWWYSARTRTLSARVTPSTWAAEKATARRGPALFWITPPSNNAFRCPEGFRAVEPGASPSGARVGLVSSDDRASFAPLERPVELVASKAESARVAPRLRLRLEGILLVPPDSTWASACQRLESGAAPDCVLFVRFSRVALQLESPGPAILSEWAQGRTFQAAFLDPLERSRQGTAVGHGVVVPR
jgi:hypothetical protein